MKEKTVEKLLEWAMESETKTGTDLPFKIGEKYFVRTVTHYMVGKLEEITGNFMVFSNASWIADTGRFADFLKTGEASEVEPVIGLYRLAVGSVVDVFDFEHTLPKSQK